MKYLLVILGIITVGLSATATSHNQPVQLCGEYVSICQDDGSCSHNLEVKLFEGASKVSLQLNPQNDTVVRHLNSATEGSHRLYCAAGSFNLDNNREFYTHKFWVQPPRRRGGVGVGNQ